MDTENQEVGQEVEIDAPEGVTQEEDLQPSTDDSGPTDAAKESELQDYSKGVKTRINKLTEKYRTEERERREAVRIAEELRDENLKLRGRVNQLDTGYLDQYGARAEAQVAAARQMYKDAHESGDTDRIVTAQEALSRAVADQDRYNVAKSRAARQEERAELQRRQSPPPQMQPSPQVQQAPPAVDPKAQTWAEKNAWFGQDEVMTYAAFGVHRKLVEDEGFDPQSEEYYTEVDRRMRAEFPNKFKADRKTGGARVASASSSASRTTTQGRRSVKLTPSQIAIANKLNVPLEEYAKYVKD